MLKDIYMLLTQDEEDFRTLNALPENNRGPQVVPMTYINSANESSASMTFTGTPDAVIPAGFMFTNVAATDIWVVSKPFTLDGGGNAAGIRGKCFTEGPIEALAGTLTNIYPGNTDVTSITNPYDAVVSGKEYGPCVDKATIDNEQPKPPDYQPWVDAMETNQSISTREVIPITVG